MIKRIALLVLSVAVGLSAELWINAIRDPGAELGQGDWGTDFKEWPEDGSGADSAEVSEHDSTRAYEGNYSFLTDTDTYPGVRDVGVKVWCSQNISIPKAVADIDSCFWVLDVEKKLARQMDRFIIIFTSHTGKHIRWLSGSTDPVINDTLFTVQFPEPDSGVWTEYGYDFYDKWVGARGWPSQDTIVRVQLHSWGIWVERWLGQEVSWDNIELRSIAYYDYAAESIDSEPWETTPRSYVPIATFSNKGKLDDFSTFVYAEIYRTPSNEVVYRDSVEVSIPSDDSQQVTFTQYQHEPDVAGYTLRVFPILENDEYSQDDTLELELISGVNEEPSTREPLSLDVTYSTIRYTLPTAEPGILSIYDATGRRIERLQVNGSGSVEFSKSLPSGVYLVQLKSKGESVARKALILK